MKIFFSHLSRDKATVREFKEGLPTFLLSWLDEDSLCWGDRLQKSIREAIDSEVDYLIVFLSSDTLRSKWVLNELKWALEREDELGRNFVLPINLSKSDKLPDTLKDRLFLRLPDFAEGSVRDLARRASDHLFRLVVQSLPKPGSSWSRRVVRLPLAEEYVRGIRDVLKRATAAADAALKALLSQARMKPSLRRKQSSKNPPSPKSRANIFLPEIDRLGPECVCTLRIPKTRRNPAEWLEWNMEENEEKEIPFRPGEGATGRVFVDQCAVGAIAKKEKDGLPHEW